MHMADALVSPAVGGTMWVAAIAAAAYCAHKLKNMPKEKIPLMGVLGAFVFAAQMINFAIPVTGSSGHLGGGLLLAMLLGPYAAYIVMFSILSVQALFFADGGILALGCNVFNMGFWSCLVAYPFIFKRIMKNRTESKPIMLITTVFAAIIGLQLGAFSVVVETLLSGITELPFKTFVLLMQPIHLAIGVVEGVVTLAVVSYVMRARPEILEFTQKSSGKRSAMQMLVTFLIAAILTGGILSWFASANPDGLEWAMFNTSGQEELKNPESATHALLSGIQTKTAVLPDYNFSDSAAGVSEEEGQWPVISAGTSLSGIVGGAIVLLLTCLAGLLISMVRDNGSRTANQ